MLKLCKCGKYDITSKKKDQGMILFTSGRSLLIENQLEKFP